MKCGVKVWRRRKDEALGNKVVSTTEKLLNGLFLQDDSIIVPVDGVVERLNNKRS